MLGHGEAPGESHTPVTGPRMAFIPLPSIERRGDGPPQVVTSIRRAMIAVFGGSADDDLRRVARLLSGSDLIREEDGEVVAMLSLIPKTDPVVSLYTRPSSTWATVTPVILPGYDDPKKLRKRLFPGPEAENKTLDPEEQTGLRNRLDRRIDYLLRKAIVQAGYSRDLAQYASVNVRTVGFWPGTEPATLRVSERVERATVDCTCGSPGEMPRSSPYHCRARSASAAAGFMASGCSREWIRIRPGVVEAGP